MNRPRPRLCCATLYDAPFSGVGRFCLASLVDYGRRHEYDVVHATPFSRERPVSWQKLPLVESLFDAGYEYVFWVDADAIVVDPAVDIADEIRPDKDLYLVRHAIRGKMCPNMGVFLLRNSDWSRRLLRDLWGLTQYVHHPWWETAAIKHLLYRDEFAEDGITNATGPWLDQSRIEWLDERWNHFRHVTRGPAVVKHFAGATFRKRIKRMLLNFHPLAHLWAACTSRFEPLVESRYPATLAVDAWRGEPLSRAA